MFGKPFSQRWSRPFSHEAFQSRILAQILSSEESGCPIPQYGQGTSSTSPVYHFHLSTAVLRTRPIWNLFMFTSVSCLCSLERITVVFRSAMSASVLMIARLRPRVSHTACDWYQSKISLLPVIDWKRTSGGYFYKRNWVLLI